MAVKQTKLISTLRSKVEEIDETARVPGYHKQLWEALSQIVMAEREHKEAATQIQKKVTDRVIVLGTHLHTEGWNG
jgi:hypothetical protein